LLWFPAHAQTGARSSPAPSPPLSQPVIEVAAFRVAPVKPGPQDIRRKIVTVDDILSLPPPAAGGEAELEVRVQAAELWPDILRRIYLGLKLPLPIDDMQRQSGLFPLLQPGKFLRARSAPDGLLEIQYIVKTDEAYTISIRGSLVQIRPHVADPREIERMQADPSKASLFTATNAIGLPESIALHLTEIFAGEVDFHRELHQGYRCAIVYEAHYREGFIERSGRILAAELDVGARRFQAYLSRDTLGRDAYFDATGKTTRRAHRGVDYAAPIGAKVMAVAEGVVESMGANGDYGNLIVLRHQDKFKTYYAHLSEYATRLAVGEKVEQGQTIGLVGMTGLANGPHLHFEFHTRDASGAWVAVPAPDVIESTVLAVPEFPDVVRGYRKQLSVAETVNFVTLD
jgi:Peptidase family M23